ncbi:DUF6249 domain-containing protein [Simiduia aestuariiviva]|uniref:DUF6249 domain-containing protein n=1 Tax=Simiduia aestuariiviva TaxID=1510459 RepID=A0A839UHY0_9GAMM|nr:DUF6249 domain-containing protein [Simiduia aestuariiviva]MBB3167462.1 hypothetical protein [Simiduia aestuariiviva]
MDGILIPIFGIMFTFGAPVIIVWLALRYNERKKALMHETINKLVETNQPVPTELISAFEQRPRTNMLQNGIILLGVAVGLFVFLQTLTSIKIASVAAIPLSLGLAFLLIARMEKSQDAN